MPIGCWIPTALLCAWSAWAATPSDSGAKAAHGAIVVACESGVEAYADVLEGLGAVLPPNAIRVADFSAAGGGRLLTEALTADDVRLVITVGSRALAEVESRHAVAPVVAAMVLHGAGAGLGSHVDLEVPLSAQLAAMRALWPGRLRVGIIRNPALSRYSAEALEARARKEGYTAVVVDCDEPARLLRAVGALKGKVDFLLSFPDPELYNPVTIKPLVLASLEGRLPIVGFSPAFVRAGAAVGIYPDYREIGRQTAEMALRLLRGGKCGREESPRKIQVAVNQRVARLLGLEFQTEALPVAVFR
jgi:putative ABC transport system substrate-binding protein